MLAYHSSGPMSLYLYTYRGVVCRGPAQNKGLVLVYLPSGAIAMSLHHLAIMHDPAILACLLIYILNSYILSRQVDYTDTLMYQTLVVATSVVVECWIECNGAGECVIVCNNLFTCCKVVRIELLQWNSIYQSYYDRNKYTLQNSHLTFKVGGAQSYSSLSRYAPHFAICSIY